MPVDTFPIPASDSTQMAVTAPPKRSPRPWSGYARTPPRWCRESACQSTRPGPSAERRNLRSKRPDKPSAGISHMGKLTGKSAVITGAASGIGRACALSFAREGALLVIADLNEHEGTATAEQCIAAGGRALYRRTDVASEAEIKGAIEQAIAAYGRLDIMFNNAGVPGALGPIET